MILITYDIKTDHGNGARRLRRIAKACLDYGVRVQYSVFECDVDPAQWVSLKSSLLSLYDEDADSLRFYHLGKRWRPKVEHYGAKPPPDIFDDTLII